MKTGTPIRTNERTKSFVMGDVNRSGTPLATISATDIAPM